MFGDQATLWPVHPKLIYGELLSSWVTRIASGLGMSLKTFSGTLLPVPTAFRNDMDRISDPDFFDALSWGTQVPVASILASSLNSHAGILYTERGQSGPAEWIVDLGNSVRKRKKPRGLPFCPECLANDPIPHYRKAWRYGFHAVCPRHGMLLLSCPSCKAPYSFQSNAGRQVSMGRCHACGQAFSGARRTATDVALAAAILPVQERILRAVEEGWIELPSLGPVHIASYMSGLRALVTFLFGEDGHEAVRWVASESNAPFRARRYRSFQYSNLDDWGIRDLEPFDAKRPEVRAEILYLASWLTEEWPNRFIAMCQATGVSRSGVLGTIDRIPYWMLDDGLGAVEQQTRPISEEEFAAAANVLRRKRSWAPTPAEVRHFILTGSVPPITSKRRPASPASKKAMQEFGKHWAQSRDAEMQRRAWKKRRLEEIKLSQKR